MNKKKLLSLSILGVSAVLALAGCDSKGGSSSSESSSSSEAHVHTAGTEWKHDEKNHWHLCTGCGEKLDVAAHSFEEHVVAPTDDAQGYTEHVCACGYTYKDTYVDKEYEVTFEGGDYAFVLGLPEKSKAGEKIKFKVTLESGYEAYSVTASYGEGEDAKAIELDGSLKDGFSFTMPKAAVTIKAETRGAYFEVGPEDASAEVFKPEAKDASAKKISDFIGGYIVDDKLVTGETTIYARAGSTVRLLRNYVALAANTVYTVDGVALEDSTYTITKTVGEGDEAKTEEHTYNVVEFVMPTHSANVEVTAEEKLIEFEVEAPDYVISKTYVKDADGNEIDATSIHAYAGNNYSAPDTAKMFIEVSLDGEHQNGKYKISGVSYEYTTFAGYEVKDGTKTSSTLSLISQKDEKATYYFIPTTYTAYYGKIKLKVETVEAKYDSSCSWVGTFGGNRFSYNYYNGDIYKGSPCTATADAFGDFSLSGSYSTTKYSITADDATNKKLSLTRTSWGTTYERDVYYDNNTLVTAYNDDSTDYSSVYILIKGKTSSDIEWDYETYSSEGSMEDSSAAYIIAKDSDGNELGNFLKADTDIYLNVTVEKEDGSTDGVTVDGKSNFVVKKDGVKVGHYGVTDGTFGKIED